MQAKTVLPLAEGARPRGVVDEHLRRRQVEPAPDGPGRRASPGRSRSPTRSQRRVPLESHWLGWAD